MLSVIILGVVIPSSAIFSVNQIFVIMLGVVILSVIILSVVM